MGEPLNYKGQVSVVPVSIEASGLIDMTAGVAIVMMVLLLLVPLSAARSAVSYPRSVWRSVGRSHRRWSWSFSVIPFGIAWIAAAVYFVMLRPRLDAAARGIRLEPGRRVRFHTATGSAPGILVRPATIYGMPGWVVSYELADGTPHEWRFVTMALEPLGFGSSNLDEQPSVSGGAGGARASEVPRGGLLLGVVAIAIGLYLVVTGGPGGASEVVITVLGWGVVVLGSTIALLSVVRARQLLQGFRTERRDPRQAD